MLFIDGADDGKSDNGRSLGTNVEFSIGELDGKSLKDKAGGNIGVFDGGSLGEEDALVAFPPSSSKYGVAMTVAFAVGSKGYGSSGNRACTFGRVASH